MYNYKFEGVFFFIKKKKKEVAESIHLIPEEPRKPHKQTPVPHTHNAQREPTEHVVQLEQASPPPEDAAASAAAARPA